MLMPAEVSLHITRALSDGREYSLDKTERQKCALCTAEDCGSCGFEGPHGFTTSGFARDLWRP